MENEKGVCYEFWGLVVQHTHHLLLQYIYG